MMKRFSASLRGKKDKDGRRTSTTNGSSQGDDQSVTTDGASQTNGLPQTNGVSQVNGDYKSKSSKGSTPGKTKTEAQGRYPDPPNHEASREDVQTAVNSLIGVISHSMRGLSGQNEDGTYDTKEVHASMWNEMSSLGFRDVKALLDQLAQGKEPVDDKTMLMERVIQLVARLPSNSIHRKQLTDTVVDQLFYSLPHPPQSYLGEQFRYRQADGSYNNILYPHIGKANSPYARTVRPMQVQPGALPDPGLVFDSLMARETFRPHPNKNSSVIFYWASIIIHDLFQTDHADFSNSQTSSYLDLSPLYGDTQEDQNTIRTFKDGLLKPDCFCEHRLLTFPPGCGVILIMFNRFHNYVATQLAAINEGHRFDKPSDKLPEEKAKKAWAKYDNDLFQTARLVTGGLYINITLIDYVGVIVNLNRSNTTWTLDPRVMMGDGTLFNSRDKTEWGTGNQVSAEFNLVYRWHSAISDKDDKWTQNLFKKMFGKPAEELSMPELLAGLTKWEQSMPEDPQAREFNGLKRGSDGKFEDDDLAEIMIASVEDCAGAFGANHIPKALKAIDILGMKQARAWDCCSLNEFRNFFGLKKHSTFEDINSDPKVAEQMRHLYEHPDKVELYTGLVAENAKDPIPEDQGGPVGVGIAPTYSITRAILSDAVALVRGDRFYTVQYNFDVEQGCNFYKLFIRALPNHFQPNSIYAHHPMIIPSENRKIMQNLGRESHYNFERPKRIPGRVMIQNYHGVRQVLENSDVFKSPWGEPCGYIMGPHGKDFMLCGDTKFFTKQRQIMKEALYKDQWEQHVKDFYFYITKKLIKQKSHKIAKTNQVDIVRDVGNLAHIHFAANVFSLPLKSDESPRGVYSEHELWLVMSLLFLFIFFDVDPVKTFPLALGARKTTMQLGQLILANVKFVSSTGWLSGITDKMHQNHGPLADYGVHMVRRLLDSGMDAEEITYSQILPTAGAMVANQAQVFAQIIDWYMGPGHAHWAEITRLAKIGDSHSEAVLLRYVMEAIRLNGIFGSYRTPTSSTTVNDTGFQGPSVNIKPDDKVFVSFVKANRDPEVFPSPDEVKLDRPMDRYIHYGVGQHQCLGMGASRIALTQMLKACAQLENLRPAPGPQGELKKIPREDGF
ncbi:MAG: hypothetical protein M1828_003636 [Chrysothrix sp. TS-e1954]|nr:MAG: hypothetical protein M1828_003636 [Chrysothrix sp. TS-e1954]